VVVFADAARLTETAGDLGHLGRPDVARGGSSAARLFALKSGGVELRFEHLPRPGSIFGAIVREVGLPTRSCICGDALGRGLATGCLPSARTGIRWLTDAALEALSAEFATLYSSTGRPSIPPEKLLRAMLLHAFYSIRSERLLMERLEYDLLFQVVRRAGH
jgi:hypothetical protein